MLRDIPIAFHRRPILAEAEPLGRARFTREGWLKRSWTVIRGLVHKVDFAVGVKCRILSGGCGIAGWSNSYSQ